MSVAAASARTLLLLSEAFHRHGGIQTFNRNLVEALRRAEPDFPPAVLVLGDSNGDVGHPEWRGVRARGFSGRRLAFAAGSLRLARRLTPRRIVLGHRNLLPLVPPLRVVQPHALLWLVVHGIDAAPPLRASERWALSFVDQTLAVSPQTAGAFVAAGARSEPLLFPNALPFWRREEGAPPRTGSGLRLLTVARLSATETYKGIHDVIEAVARQITAGRDVRLDVVGDGDDRERLEELARRLTLADRVRFLGWLDDAALGRAYAECDVFVLASAGEGFGIVYLEAMAAGRPVVAARAGGVPFVVRPESGGELVEPGSVKELAECLGRLADDPERRVSAGRRARAFALDTFGFDLFVERTRDLLCAPGERPA